MKRLHIKEKVVSSMKNNLLTHGKLFKYKLTTASYLVKAGKFKSFKEAKVCNGYGKTESDQCVIKLFMDYNCVFVKPSHF